MKKPLNFLKVIPLAMVVCSSILVSTAEPASAWWRTNYLGQATIRDNSRYARSIGRIATGTPPWNRDLICRWKYPRRNGTVYGKPASWWGTAHWETNCYHRYWRWWW
ncbi:MAG: hypothetical protein AB4080_20990 [Trichodesmium sp.]